MKQPIQMLEVREMKLDAELIYWEESYHDQSGRLQVVRSIQIVPIQGQGLGYTHQVRMQVRSTIGEWNAAFNAQTFEQAVDIYEGLKTRTIHTIYPDAGDPQSPEKKPVEKPRGFWRMFRR